jgi:hypothetical protein
MNLLGRLAQVYVPPLVRRWLLTRLFEQTAAAFAISPSVAPHGGNRQVLEAFADYSARAAMARSPSPNTVRRLFEGTRSDGAWLRRALGVNSTRDVMAVARIVYRALGIDFAGNPLGEIRINRCFFSTRYTPETCQLMSALDAGLLAGLSNGGHLVFSQRITEGYPCCRALLVPRV